MAPTRVAKIIFVPTKSCFVSIPKAWSELLQGKEFAVLEVLYGKNRKAYLSWAGDYCSTSLSSDEAILQLDGLYGTKLRLVQDEEVVVQIMDNSCLPCEKAFLEPLSVDDWEILESNASSIENILMNQIRIIWKEQVFPIWVQKNVCIFVRVVDIYPNKQPLLLIQNTEVIVNPRFPSTSKYQDVSEVPQIQTQTDSDQMTSAMSDSADTLKHSKTQNTRTRSDSTSYNKLNVADSDLGRRNSILDILSYFSGIVRSVWDKGQETDEDDLDVQTQKEVEQFASGLNIKFPVNLMLRVVPIPPQTVKFTNRDPNFLTDASVVYLNSSSLPPELQSQKHFFASLKKLPSPTERNEEQKKSSQSSSPLRGEEKSKSNQNSSHKAKSKKAHSNEKHKIQEYCIVQVIVADNQEDRDGSLVDLTCNLMPNSVAVPDVLRRKHGLETTSIVCLNILTSPLKPVTSLELYPILTLPSDCDEEDIICAFKDQLRLSVKHGPAILISSGMLLNLHIMGKVEGADFLLFPNSSKDPDHPDKLVNNLEKNDPVGYYLSFRNLYADKIEITVGQSQDVQKPWHLPLRGLQEIDLPMPGVRLEELGGVNAIAEKCLLFIKSSLGLGPLASYMSDGSLIHGGLVICGSKGSGKSTLTKAICRCVMKAPHHVYVHGIDCKRLRGKSVDTITKMWEKVAAEAVHRQPSIILLDDLDIVAAAPAMENETDPEEKNTVRIVEALISVFNVSCKVGGAKIMVIATSKSWKSLHPLLTTSRGHHVFQEIVEIPPPDLTTREEILKALILSKPHLSPETIKNVPLSKLASLTEGYDAQDLSTLIDRATHAAWIRTANTDSSQNQETVLANQDFEIAIDGFRPASLHGLKLHQSGTIGLGSVGGLSAVKSVIKETLMWPSKYPALFASCPLRPQMSILFFGAPGTGKTLLAEAVAHECALNFISIKGPELLSKYIGGSEQGIRDVFQRAQRAKPCILFFDEFDAIAPRRGHDNTGVTDRVVNQILTQMDGVEGLQGVYVLAATSRPDLLDPALLRPGRFDKCLYCPLPNKEERLEILDIHSSHLSLANDVNLEHLADATPFFSGADLQALLYNAQLEALHDDPHYRSRMSEAIKEKVSTFVDAPFDENEMAKLAAQQRKRRKSSAVALADDILYFPSVEEGVVQLGLEETKAILKEVSVIKDNLRGISHSPKHRRRRTSTFTIAITADHLMRVVKKMKPSVSEVERKRYNDIYEAFTRSRGGDFSIAENVGLSGGKRVTLA